MHLTVVHCNAINSNLIVSVALCSAMQWQSMHYEVQYSCQLCTMQCAFVECIRRGNGFVPVRRGGHLTPSVSLIQLIDHHLEYHADHQEADP